MPDENPREGSDEAKAKKLITELELRARYYFKDFGTAISAITAPLYVIISRGRSEDKAGIIRECVGTITRCYDLIPFDEITGHPDCDIFLEVKNMISELKREIDMILNGEKNDVTEAHQLIIAMMDKGEEYRGRLKAIYKRIQSIPGFENYEFKIKSPITGEEWSSFYGL